MAEANGKRPDPAVIAWHVDIVYEVLGGKKRGTAAGQGERSGLRKIFKPDAQIGGVRHVHAVKDVSFVAEKGESIGIIGHNGSGKSTLLRALAGLMPPTNGKIWLQGSPSLLGVNAVLLNQLSGERNVHIGGQALGMTPAQIEAAYEDIVSLADIGEAIDRPMATYSSGQGARLRFAISTAVKPDVLMIDEALATGDAAFQKRSNAKIRELLEGASTVFLVSHSNNTITEMCQRALWLDHGRLVMDGPAAEVVAEYAKGTVPTGPTIKPPPRVIAIPDLGKNARSLPVDETPPPITRTILWDSGTITGGGSFTEAQQIERLAALASSGVTHLFLNADGATGLPEPVHELGVVVDLGGEALPTRAEALLAAIRAVHDETLFLSHDDDARASVADAMPGVRTASLSDPTIVNDFDEAIRYFQGSSEAPRDSVRALIRRHDDRLSEGVSEASHLSEHGLHIALLEGLAAVHLGTHVEAVVNESKMLNFTHSRFGLGEATGFLVDVSRNLTRVVVAWDEYGFHGVVGFVSVDAAREKLRHFVFADRIAGLGVPETVASMLMEAAPEASTVFPVEGARPWITVADPASADVMARLAAKGLGPVEQPDVRIMAGNDTGRLALLLQPLTLQGSVRQGAESMKFAGQASFCPDARVVAYAAGREYDDRIWGGGPQGLEYYRRSAQKFVEQTSEATLVVLLPNENFRHVASRPFTRPEQFAELNGIWRGLAEENSHVELVETSTVLDGAESVNPLAVGSDVLEVWAAAIKNAVGSPADGDQQPNPGQGAQHLNLVAHVVDLGDLAKVPLTLPHTWDDSLKADTWEIEVLTSQERFSERSALALFDVDDVDAVTPVPGGISVFGKPSAQFFHYLRTQGAQGVTRFTIQGTRPFALSSVALQLWGPQPVDVHADAVRIWARRPPAAFSNDKLTVGETS